MYTDLHLHTIYSDGEYQPLQVVTMARDRNASMIAISDHNNIEGSKIAVANNPYDDIVVIPSVEFTAKSPANINIHILGHNIDLKNKALNELCDAYTEDSRNRTKSLLLLLKKHYGMEFDKVDVAALLSSIGNIGRPEVAKLCLKYGYVSSIPEAFDNYLNPVKPLITEKKVDPTDKELIECILKAGGVPCLAHPRSLKKTIPELREYILKLKGYGLMAIEAYHSDCSKELTFELLKMAHEFDLYVSCGSDYHGPIVTPKVQIRSGRNNNLNIERVSIMNLFTEVKGYDEES
jgi:predicted metal-dependent phosphoesterase TrpH